MNGAPFFKGKHFKFNHLWLALLRWLIGLNKIRPYRSIVQSPAPTGFLKDEGEPHFSRSEMRQQLSNHFIIKFRSLFKFILFIFITNITYEYFFLLFYYFNITYRRWAWQRVVMYWDWAECGEWILLLYFHSLIYVRT